MIMTKEEVIIAIKNRKNFDKYSLAWILDQIVQNGLYVICLNAYKRQELETVLIKELNNDSKLEIVKKLNSFKNK